MDFSTFSLSDWIKPFSVSSVLLFQMLLRRRGQRVSRCKGAISSSGRCSLLHCSFCSHHCQRQGKPASSLCLLPSKEVASTFLHHQLTVMRQELIKDELLVQREQGQHKSSLQGELHCSSRFTFCVAASYLHAVAIRAEQAVPLFIWHFNFARKTSVTFESHLMFQGHMLLPAVNFFLGMSIWNTCQGARNVELLGPKGCRVWLVQKGLLSVLHCLWEKPPSGFSF